MTLFDRIKILIAPSTSKRKGEHKQKLPGVVYNNHILPNGTIRQVPARYYKNKPLETIEVHHDGEEIRINGRWVVIRLAE